jgi:hypothetical protein
MPDVVGERLDVDWTRWLARGDGHASARWTSR